MIGKREMQKITMTEKLIRNENEAIEAIKANMPTSGYQMLRESLDIAIKALEEIQQYRAIGTVEEVEQNARDLKRQIEHSEHLAEVLKSTKSLLEKRGRLLSDYCKIGTVEECRKAREKLPVAEEAIRKLLCSEYGSSCQFCIHDSDEDAVCCNIGGSGSWCCKNAKWNGRLE